MGRVIGVLEFLKVYKKTWGLAFLRLDDGTELRCTGTPLRGLKRGQRYEFSGDTVKHHTYGIQFDVAKVTGRVGEINTGKKARAASVSRRPATSHKATRKKGWAKKGRPSWADAGCRPASYAPKLYQTVPAPFGMPGSEEEAELILLYEQAHHIGLDCRLNAGYMDVEGFVSMVARQLQANVGNLGRHVPDVVALAAAQHAAKELI